MGQQRGGFVEHSVAAGAGAAEIGIIIIHRKSDIEAAPLFEQVATDGEAGAGDGRNIAPKRKPIPASDVEHIATKMTRTIHTADDQARMLNRAGWIEQAGPDYAHFRPLCLTTSSSSHSRTSGETSSFPRGGHAGIIHVSVVEGAGARNLNGIYTVADSVFDDDQLIIRISRPGADIRHAPAQ
jgi:hypothetical protein